MEIAKTISYILSRDFTIYLIIMHTHPSTLHSVVLYVPSSIDELKS